MHPLLGYQGADSERNRMHGQSTFNRGRRFQDKELNDDGRVRRDRGIGPGRRGFDRFGQVSGLDRNYSGIRHNDFGRKNMGSTMSFKKKIVRRNEERTGINDQQINFEDNADRMRSLFETTQRKNEMKMPFASIHPKPLIPGLRQDTNEYQEFPQTQKNLWPHVQHRQATILNFEMVHSFFENIEAKQVLHETSNKSLPEVIKNEVKRAEEKRLRPKHFELGEIHSQVISIQNKIWMWNCHSQAVGTVTFPVSVSKVQLLKIMGSTVFLWVETKDQQAYVIQVSRSEENEDNLVIAVLLKNQKSLFAVSWKWVDYINGVVFVDTGKKVGTLVFDEDYVQVRVKTYANPSTSKAGRLKRVKKSVLNLITWSKYLDFKIKIQCDRLFILKTSFQVDSRLGRRVEVNNPLHPHTNNIPEKPLKICSQSIYSYCMTVNGSLICNGKLPLKKLFLENQQILNSHFNSSGGFDISLRVVDFRIKDINKPKLLERSFKARDTKIDFLKVTKDLNEDLMQLSNSFDVMESTMVSPSLCLLLESGVEMEVHPFEGLIQRIETLRVEGEDQNHEFLGYLDKGEVLLQRAESIYMMTR
jgi:hypothetical protein